MMLEVQNLEVHFPIRKGPFGGTRGIIRAVNGVDLKIAKGETLGLVGESGCGKSTLGRAIVGLVPPAAGSILFEGKPIAGSGHSEFRADRQKVQMIFQDPYGSLNPRMTVAQIVAEPLEIHSLCPDKTQRMHRVIELLESVGLHASAAERFPHEFSGGQRQRISIARALAVQPKLLVCDEPVSALDVSVQAQVVNLLAGIQKERNLGMLFIGHDLAVVEHISHRIAVMYLGRIVEIAAAAELVHSPQHPYTQALISAVPVVDPEKRTTRILLPGDMPSPADPPSGCPFHPRCPVAIDKCRTVRPALLPTTPGHQTACHFPKGAPII